MRTFIFLTLFLSTSSVFSQSIEQNSVQIDYRLYEAFDSSYLQSLEINNPFIIQRWNFFLDNSFFITEYPKEKGNPGYPEITIEDIENINILRLKKELKLHRDRNKQIVYRIKDSNKVLVFYSGKKFTKMLNNFLGRNYKTPQ